MHNKLFVKKVFWREICCYVVDIIHIPVMHIIQFLLNIIPGNGCAQTALCIHICRVVWLVSAVQRLSIAIWVLLFSTQFSGMRIQVTDIFMYMQYTGCHRRKGPNFGRVFLMLNYTDITQSTYIQSWTVMEIMAREVWNTDSCYTLTDCQIHIETGRNMWFL